MQVQVHPHFASRLNDEALFEASVKALFSGRDAKEEIYKLSYDAYDILDEEADAGLMCLAEAIIGEGVVTAPGESTAAALARWVEVHREQGSPELSEIEDIIARPPTTLVRMFMVRIGEDAGRIVRENIGSLYKAMPINIIRHRAERTWEVAADTWRGVRSARTAA